MCQVAPYSVAIPLPALQRAALAITRGKPAELRRLAHDLQRAGQDTEAGLLENYALLLERTKVSRARVLTEVTRMLRSAAANRRGGQRAAPAIPWPPRAVPEARAAADVGRTREPTPPAREAARESVVAPATGESNAVVVFPVFAIGAARRASR